MEQMTKKHNETGRSMVEMLGVLAIMGVLSLTAIAGITYAMRRQAVVDTVDLINKSSAGILTSGFFKEGTEDEEELPEVMVDSEPIPLNVYMSNVTLTSAAEKDVYGNETFVGPRGSVFSAYPSAVQGGGFMLAVNNMQSAVCEDVLSYDLDYDAVVRVGTDGQPIRDFVDAIDLDDASKRKDFCRLGEDEEALNVGFVFNKISPDDDGSNQPECNSNCSIAILGDCGLTKTEACAERQYYATDCTCQCYVGSLANGCACPTNTPVWNTTTKQCEACPTETPKWSGSVCVECLTNTDCTDSTEPLCDAGTCVQCPNGEVWDANDKTCRATQEGVPCSSDEDCGNMICTPENFVDMTGQDTNNNTKYDRSCCPKDKPFWNGSACSKTFEITKRYGYIDTGSLVNSLIFKLGAYPFDYTLKCNMMIDDAIDFNGGGRMNFWGGTGPFTRDVNKGETLTTTLWNNTGGHAATGSCTINPK